MKKSLLVAVLFAVLTLNTKAQSINNSSFETWITQTANFDGFGGFFPPETFQFSDPDLWTTTNALSGADTLGNFFFVTETSNAHTGTKAMQLTTDTLKTVGTPLGPRRLTIPGLALNGDFPLDLNTSLVTGGTISPTALPGAGQPFTKRLAAIKGFYNYTPVFNDSLGHIDSCTVWAVLRKGTKLIANAQFTSGANTGGYVAFSQPFEYFDCEDPDTLVILIAASVPNLGSVLTGQTALVPGSVLLVDDLDYDTLPSGYNYAPIARPDLDTTSKNTPKNIVVKLNDDDCNDLVASLTVAIATQPVNGTATLNANIINYTPNNNFVGYDSLSYTLTDGTFTSSAKVHLVVLNSSGINDENLIPVTVYPVPANNTLNIQFENNGKSFATVYNMLGSVLSNTTLTGNNSAINIETLSNGLYTIQITNEKGAAIARTKFTVAK